MDWGEVRDEFQWPRHEAPLADLIGFLGGRLVDKLFRTENVFGYRLPAEDMKTYLASPPDELTPEQIEEIDKIVAAFNAEPLPHGEIPKLYG